MKLLYFYSNCSEKKYAELFQNSDVMILQQAQKYHSLLLKGLTENGADVVCCSGLPVNRDLTSALHIRGGRETVDGVKYHYYSTFNVSAIRRIQLIFKSFFTVLFAKKDCTAVCDILNTAMVMGVIPAARLRGIKTLGIVTDVPGHRTSSKKFDPIDAIDASFTKKFDSYVILTEAMNQLVNPKGKPFSVLEGHVDSRMENVQNPLEEKSNPKVMLYAGSLKTVYGIEKLTEAFQKSENSGWEFHIYGDGNFKPRLLEICRENPNVKYMGVRPNKEIVEAELRASLLVNPRPTKDDYVLYSFPSKNMEYMASGTPVLTTPLPGMPKEYYPYIYIFEDESAHGMSKKLSELFALSASVLHEKGAAAKTYVLKNKNSKVQAEKILRMVEEITK